MAYKLTEEELSWIDTTFTLVNEELNETISKLGVCPIRYTPTGLPSVSAVEAHTERLRRILKREAHAEDFIALEAMGRVRLSDETRRAELKRLRRKHVKRKKYTFRYGRKHNKLKEKTKKEYNNRRWDKEPLTRLRYTSRKPVDITQEDWDRCIAATWNQYDRKYLKLKCSGDKMTIHNLVIEYHPPRERYSRKVPKPEVVYDGLNQAIYDAMKK